MEQSSDLNMQPSSKIPVEYSRDPYKEEGVEKTGNTGVQECEQATWEISGEPSTETTPNSSVESNKEQTQKPTTEVSGKTYFVFDCPHVIVSSLILLLQCFYLYCTDRKEHKQTNIKQQCFSL